MILLILLVLNRQFIGHHFENILTRIEYLCCGYVKENYKEEWIILPIKSIIAHFFSDIEYFEQQQDYEITNEVTGQKCVKLTTGLKVNRYVSGSNINKSIVGDAILTWTLEVKLTGLSHFGIHCASNNTNCLFNINYGEVANDYDIHKYYSNAFDTFCGIIKIKCDLTTNYLAFDHYNYNELQTTSMNLDDDSETESDFYEGDAIYFDFSECFYLRFWMENESDWVKLLSFDHQEL